MARMTNQVRSLQIIARQNGWDPNAIVGDTYSYREDRVVRGDYQDAPTPNRADEVQGSTRMLGYPGEMPPKTNAKTNGANPFPGMPGAR